MGTLQPREIRVAAAMAEAPDGAATLAQLAARHRAGHGEVDQCQTIRHWQADAGTFCYQTHIAISGQASQRLRWLTDVFYNAATLPRQPWYPQFLGGASEALDAPPAPGIDRHQLTCGRFHLGVSTPRHYRQLVSLARPDAQTAVIVARSVDEGPAPPGDAVLAYTLPPNGEVLHWQGDRLHWHHICCTPGAALLPGRLDRWLINALRRLGMDGAERATYRQEAEELRDWLQSPHPEAELATAAH